ncbi:putative DNA ligase [Lyophyllum shimeji]|uniref:DNA ligase n=1 Tax=Lyophyllum shimeji TaxID=47721 RepID=A0A9P3PHE7_LYOSH|nr:putative DNA ligase [Lyophyllum shimeji]
MGRQQTLAKFFEMPPSVKPMLAQSNLKEMWGGKKKPKEPKVEEVVKLEDTMDIDKGTSAGLEHPKRKEVPVRDEQPRLKKRRILESDEESEAANDAMPEAESAPATSPEPFSSKLKPPSSSQTTLSPKSKGKAKATDLSETLGVSGRGAASALSSGDEGDHGEDELGEEDIEDEPLDASRQIATKSAEAALSRTDEVDVKGGWKVGAPVPYAALSKTFVRIEATTKRLEKNAFLTSFLLLVMQRSAKGDAKSLLQAVYLCINRLSPDYVGIELGIGESLLIKAIAESTGRSISVVKADLQREGDLGLVAMMSKSSQKTLFKPKPLTVRYVFQNLKEIALATGHASQGKKVSIITKLLAACQDFEAKYIVRSLEGKLRIGNAERSVLVAVAHAAVLAERERAQKKWSPEKLAARLEEAANIMKAVYSELPSYDEVIPALLEHGIDGLRKHCRLTPGIPLKPMLAKPTKAIGEVLDRFENKRFTCEYKYDGERAQVHKLENGTVAVFSRNSENMSKKYPDLVEQLPKCIKDSTKSFVLDAEAVAIDRTTGKLMPFQELSRRKRKDVKVEDIQVRVCLFAFDLLYLNGEPLLQKSLFERRRLLREHFTLVPGEFDFAKSSDNETTEEIQSFLEESVKDGCEGLMVKMLDSEASFYEPSRRSVNWLKLKKDYLAGVGDSLDLVVVGGYYGKGKRTNVYGAFLLACYDSESEEYQTICKIGTGFSEEALQSHYETLKPLELVKVRGISSSGPGGRESISLRFPRFIRQRDDKTADEATGPEQIAEMYERQALAQNNGRRVEMRTTAFVTR